VKKKPNVKEERTEYDVVWVFAPKGVTEFSGRDTPGEAI